MGRLGFAWRNATSTFRSSFSDQDIETCEMTWEEFKYKSIMLAPEPGIAELRGVLEIPQDTPLEHWDVPPANRGSVKCVRDIYSELSLAEKLVAIASWKALYTRAMWDIL